MGRTSRLGVPISHLLGPFSRLSLARQFLLAGLGVLLVGMSIIGIWAGRQAKKEVLNRFASTAGLYVDSVIGDTVASLATAPQLGDGQVAALDHLLGETQFGKRIVAFKVWSFEGEVLYSPNHALIGRRYPIDRRLARAFAGRLDANLSNLAEAENEYERQHWRRLLEVYVPLHDETTGQIFGAVEFYQLPNDLDSEVRSAQLNSWAIVGGVMLAMFGLLAGIVKRGSDTIGRQQVALTEKVDELSRLLDENRRLQGRVRQAAGRATLRTEQALRRIGADLHDGPGQALGLALLRLDSLHGLSAPSCQGCNGGRDFGVIQTAMRDALDEIRAISAGLRLPMLQSLTLAGVAERAVRDHERRSAIRVALTLEHLPAEAPLPIKIALFRALQESLSNATRHGGGVGVSVHISAEAGYLCLIVSDAGPGFVPAAVAGDDHLGLAGMREQAELLGGSFEVQSAPGEGTAIRLRWPLAQWDEGKHG